MPKIEPIAIEEVPAALERAERYRLMNEPKATESICLDVLNVDPENQEALKFLVLSLSEQFKSGLHPAFDRAKDVLSRITDEYIRLFYKGVIYERQAMAHLAKEGFGAGWIAHDCFENAMACYRQAMRIRPERNPDALLRWNTCVRIMQEHPEVAPEPRHASESMLE